MDSNDEYEDGTDTRVLLEHGYAVSGYEKEVERRNSSSSENGDDYDDPLVLSHPHRMDIPSVRRCQRWCRPIEYQLSAHDLPLAALAVVERELFHSYTHTHVPIHIHIHIHTHTQVHTCTCQLVGAGTNTHSNKLAH